MSQITLDLQTTRICGDTLSSHGFEIGWDYAHHSLALPAELLLEGTHVAQGWSAARAVFGRRTLVATRTVRLWLQLRASAWHQGVPFDKLQVTPEYLSQIHSESCPVLRQTLGGAAGSPLAAVVQRLNPQVGFAAGNLVVMSQAAASARQGLDLQALVRRARQAETCDDDVAGLAAAAWWRLAALTAFASPSLPFTAAARLPLAVLPPNRVRVLNAALGLQVLLTQLFSRPGWSARARALADHLPAHTLRHDFNLFIGAMAPRVLEAGQEPAQLRRALEDAWLHERVQRRWQHFLLALGEVACENLLEHAMHIQPAGVRALSLGAEQAVEGWGLPALASAPASRPLASRQRTAQVPSGIKAAWPRCSRAAGQTENRVSR